MAANMYTHQKRPYRAVVVVWDGTNIDQIRSLLDTVSTWGATQLMVRWRDPATGRSGIETLDIGSAVVTGENGAVKIYDAKTFAIKYEVIENKQDIERYVTNLLKDASTGLYYECDRGTGFPVYRT